MDTLVVECYIYSCPCFATTVQNLYWTVLFLAGLVHNLLAEGRVGIFFRLVASRIVPRSCNPQGCEWDTAFIFCRNVARASLRPLVILSQPSHAER